MDWKVVFDGLHVLTTLLMLGLGAALAFINTKFEALRESFTIRMGEMDTQIGERKECTRHLESGQNQLAEQHHAWEKLSSVAHAELKAEVSRVAGSIEHMAIAIRDQGIDIKRMAVEVATMAVRLDACEDRLRALKFFMDNAHEIKDDDFK